MKTVRHDIFILIVAIAITQYACVASSPQKLAGKRIQEKDYQGAIEAYQTIVDSKPETPEARQAQLSIAQLYIKETYQLQQGVQIYHDLIADAPDSEEAAEAHWCLGLHALKSEDYQSAQQSFNALINNFPLLELSYNAQLMLAKSYEDAKDYQKAAEVYGNVANRYPEGKRATQALVNKARIEQEDLRDIDAAVQTYGFIIKRYGNIGRMWESVSAAEQELRLMRATIPKAEDWSMTSWEKYKQRREREQPWSKRERSPAIGEAPDYSESGFGVDPEFIFAPWKTQMARTILRAATKGAELTYRDMLLMCAHQNFDFQNYRDAGALYFHAIKLAEREKALIDLSIYYHLAACYHKLGMHQRSAKVLKKGGEKSTKHLETIIGMADNLYLEENYEAAIEIYNAVVGINWSKDSEIYWKLGVVHQKMGDYAKEAEYCERAIAIKADYADALQSLAYVLFYRLNDRDRAIIFADLAEGRGGTYETEKELGAICYKYGNYTRAKRQYDIAARIAQRHRNDATLPTEQRRYSNQIVYAKIHQAMAEHQNGGGVQAQAQIDALTAEYPNHPLIPYGHGQMALLKGDVEDAISAFKIAIEKDPASDAAPIALSEYYLAQSNLDAAIGVLEGVLKTDLRNRGVSRRLNALKRQREVQTRLEQSRAAVANIKPNPSGRTAALKSTKKRQNFLPIRQRTIYPRNYIPKSQLPSALFVGLTEDQVIEKYGEPVEILEPPPNLPNATKRFAYGALVPGISSTFSVEGSEFIFGENGVLGYRRVYFGDINSWVESRSEYPALLNEIPEDLKSRLCNVINEQVFEAARKYNLIVQKAQVVWELNDERWWATVYATFPVRDFTSDRSIKNYKAQLEDYHIMELLVADLTLHPDLFLTKPKGVVD